MSEADVTTKDPPRDGEAISSEKSRNWSERLKSWAEILGNVRSVVISVAIALFVVLVLFEFVGELTSRSVEVLPFDVPEQASKLGLSRETVSLMLRDRIDGLVASAKSDRAARGFVPTGTVADFTVPGAGFSVRALTSYVADVLGLGPTRISGTLIAKSEGKYRLVLRSSAGTRKTVLETDGSIDDVLDAGALEILRKIDPYTATMQLIGRGRADEALRSVYGLFALARESGQDGARSGGEGESAALMAWGNVLVLKKERVAAIEKFSAAAANYKRTGDHGRLAVALEAKALQMKELGHLSDAAKIYDSALRADGGYASVLVNRGLLLQELGDRCAARDMFRRAIQIDPTYSNGWHALATLNGNAIQAAESGSTAPCLPKDKAAIRAARSLAEIQFATAIGSNTGWADPWGQWGILLSESKEYDRAAEKLREAVRLDHSNGYYWLRLGKAELDGGHPRAARAALACALVMLGEGSSKIEAIKALSSVSGPTGPASVIPACPPAGP